MVLSLFAFTPQADACFYDCVEVDDIALAGGGAIVSSPYTLAGAGGLAVSQAEAESPFYASAEACSMELAGATTVVTPDGILAASGSVVAGGSHAFSHPSLRPSFWDFFCRGAEVNGFGIAASGAYAGLGGYSAVALGAAGYGYHASVSGPGHAYGNGFAATGSVTSIQTGPNSVRVTAAQGSIARSSSSARSKSYGGPQ